MIEKTEIRKLFKELEIRTGKMTQGQVLFVTSARKYFRKTGELSEKQLQALQGILKWLPSIIKTQTS